MDQSDIYRHFVKRPLDFLVSLFFGLLLLPVIILISVLVYCSVGRPIFFRQVRPGMNGSNFTLIKFRTMSLQKDSDGNLLPDFQRVGPLGRFLRASSLDELPELWNVVKGEMSLVGPRPLLVQYMSRYSANQMRRHEVQPGITGLAQVRGRNLLAWEERFLLDVWYVDNLSLIVDLAIIKWTFMAVLRREGINFPSRNTDSEFEG